MTCDQPERKRPPSPDTPTRRRHPGAQRATRNGRLAEAMAAQYLEMDDYTILARNARCGPLEVDLIATRGNTVAFVEVRMRSSRSHGRPEETVRHHKRQNLLRAVEQLARRMDLPSRSLIRLDLIAIERAGFGLRLRHYPGWLTPGVH